MIKNTRFGDYTAEERKALDDAQMAARTLVKGFTTWMVLAGGVEAAYAVAERANPSNMREAVLHILEEHDIVSFLGHTANSQYTNASKLRKIFARRDEVEAWRATLPLHKQLAWVAPSTIYQKSHLFAADRAEDKKGERTRKSGTKTDPLAKAADENRALRTELNNEKRKVEEITGRNQELNEELDTFKQKAREATADFNGAQPVKDAPTTLGALTDYVNTAIDSGQIPELSVFEVGAFLSTFIRRVPQGYWAMVLTDVSTELGVSIGLGTKEEPAEAKVEEPAKGKSKPKAEKPAESRLTDDQMKAIKETEDELNASLFGVVKKIPQGQEGLQAQEAPWRQQAGIGRGSGHRGRAGG
jgi:hypothetical protein